MLKLQIKPLISLWFNRLSHWSQRNRPIIFRYIKIKPKTIDLSSRLQGITTECWGLSPRANICSMLNFEAFWSQRTIAAGAYPRFLQHEAARSISTPPGRDASPSQVIPPQFVRFSPTIYRYHLYTWVERGTVRVKCLAQEHNTMSPARARTRTTRSGDKRTNHEATAPPTC